MLVNSMISYDMAWKGFWKLFLGCKMITWCFVIVRVFAVYVWLDVSLSHILVTKNHNASYAQGLHYFSLNKHFSFSDMA